MEGLDTLCPRLVKCLILSKIQMLKEFCSLTGAEESTFKENWKKYEDLAFKYAPLEQKRSVKLLLSQYMAEEQDDAGDLCLQLTMD